MFALLTVNRVFGSDSMQTQLNLGRTIGFDFSPQLVARAWWNFTDLGFYDYHALSHWVFALWPVALVGIGVCVRPVRERLRPFATAPTVRLSALVLAVFLGVLITTTAVFGDKFDYVGLERYYLPARPFYLLLFVAPVALIPRPF